MNKQVKVLCVFMLLVLVSANVSAYQEPIQQGVDTSQQLVVSGQDVIPSSDEEADSSQQLVIDGQDVITASDAGGGYLSSRDLILIIAIGVVILVLVAL